uniref:Protein FAM214A n=1 Tax=Zeugodacus cucurbitae TaxID=28588 RepID=A0A0A1WKU6_ZEUCU
MKLLTIGICVIFGTLADAEVLRVTPKLANLVPTIIQENYKLMPIEDTFNLSLDFPEDGNREEETKLIVDENGKEVLAVKGRLRLVYSETPLYVTIIYEADGNGYRAKYMYFPNRPDMTYFTSASFLKTAAG